jgi:hypothetical protein
MPYKDNATRRTRRKILDSERPDLVRVNNQRYYVENREKILARVALRYRENPEPRLSYSKRYHEEHRLKIAAYRKTPTRRFIQLKSIAKSRKLECTLSFELFEVLTSQPCFYCNSPLSETGHGLDRIDSNKGYIEGNVRPCCKRCNVAKNDMTEMGFKEWLTKVFENYICQKVLDKVA